MILTIWVIFLALSLVMVALGLFNPDHSELTIIGFVFIFLLALVVLNENIVYQSGENVSSTFSYTTNGNITLLTSSEEEYTYNYSPITLDGGITSHLVGYWLAVASIVGVVAVFVSFKRTKRDYK